MDEENAFVAAAPDLAGSLSYSGGILTGRLSAPVGISVYADGEVIWQGRAKAAGEAAVGLFGFDVTIPDPAGEAIITSRFLRVLAEDASEVPGSPLDVPYGDHLLGYVESINTTSDSVLISGWVIDRRFPWEPVRLNVWYAGTFLQTACTGVSRTDLGITGYDAPNGGFFITVTKPEGFDHRMLHVLPGRTATPLALTDDASLSQDPRPAAQAPSASSAGSPPPVAPPRVEPLPAAPQAAIGVEAYIDNVSSVGIVSGWARSEMRPGPVGVELWLEGERVGTATASAFRRDLLEAGVGHGHYGYNCRIRLAGARHGVLQLREFGHDTPLAWFTISPGLICEAWPKPQTVESLLIRPDHWGMEDVMRHLQALALDFNLSTLGPRRYVARVYRFLLGRWPDPPEFDFYLNDLSRGVISATDIFLIVANSEERQRRLVAPLSPYDAKFPFLPSSRHREEAR